jgi:hypothetical protein
VPAEEPAVVLVGPLLVLPSEEPTALHLRIEALRDSIRPLADSIGFAVYLRDCRNLVFTSPSRVFGPPAVASDTVGYFFTPWRGMATFQPFLPSAAALRHELLRLQRAHSPLPPLDRAT